MRYAGGPATRRSPRSTGRWTYSARWAGGAEARPPFSARADRRLAAAAVSVLSKLTHSAVRAVAAGCDLLSTGFEPRDESGGIASPTLPNDRRRTATASQFGSSSSSNWMDALGARTLTGVCSHLSCRPSGRDSPTPRQFSSAAAAFSKNGMDAASLPRLNGASS